MPVFDRQIYYRITALWIVCEAMLGGIIHGFKLPVSGLVVGSCAVICICLIGFYIPEKGAIIKATIIVAIFKMMLSPQSPVAAYIAVFFQGALGEILFLKRNHYKLSCLLLGLFALFESGIQRILVMTILFGMEFWKAVNNFISGITNQQTVTNYSFYIAGGYVLLHLIFGFIIGMFAGKIPQRLESWKKDKRNLIIADDKISESNKIPETGKIKIKTGLLVIWIVLIMLFIQSVLKIGKPLVPSHTSLQIFFRSILIILTWYFFFSPLLMSFLKRWLQKQKAKSQSELNEVFLLLPSLQIIINKSWICTSDSRGLKRLRKFCKIVLVNLLHDQHAG